MSFLSLDLNPPPTDDTPVELSSSGRPGRPPVLRPSHQLRLTYDTNRFWLPGRGLLRSFLVHEIAIAALLFYSPASASRPRVWREKHWDALLMPKDVLYLPPLGGGSKGGSTAARKPTARPNLPAPSTSGLTYAGNQEIVSDPPHPTNPVQTILQPDLPHPPLLRPYIPLPNTVILAQALPAPPPPQPVAAPAENVDLSAAPVHVPVVSLDGPTPVEAPHLTLPATPPPVSSPSLAQTPAPPPPAPVQKAPEPKAAPVPPQVLPGTSRENAHNLLVLSAVPAPPNLTSAGKVPEGEARGQFAISPNANPEQSLTGIPSGGSTNTAAPSAASPPAVAAVPDRRVGDSPSNGTAGAGESGNDVGPLSSAPSPAVAGQAGPGGKGGSGEGGGGNGGGLGAGIGPNSGTGSGTGHGPGSGAGTGPGAGPFPGMTIQGGEGPAGAIAIAGASNQTAGNPDPQPYGMTIVSTGNSGGGVGDFGIFRDEEVFTVYLNPAESKDDPSPSWALQYALLAPAGVSALDLLPPAALKKQPPEWPADLLMRYNGREIVVYAVINADGKMQQLRILQSPNARVSEVILGLFDHWLFRPASLNGKPVAVKAVLGIPISPAR